MQDCATLSNGLPARLTQMIKPVVFAHLRPIGRDRVDMMRAIKITRENARHPPLQSYDVATAGVPLQSDITGGPYARTLCCG